MAASGSNEYYEACRQQDFVNRRAYLARILWDKYASKTHEESPQILERNHTAGKSHEQQDVLRAYHLEKVYRRHDEMSKTLKQHRSPTYSAKLDQRFTADADQQDSGHSTKDTMARGHGKESRVWLAGYDEISYLQDLLPNDDDEFETIIIYTLQSKKKSLRLLLYESTYSAITEAINTI